MISTAISFGYPVDVHRGSREFYALWIARKDMPDEKRELLERFIRDLGHAKSAALKKLPELATRVDAVIPPERVAEYWRLISYDLDEKHMEGLGMFKRYLEELGLLKSL